NQTERHITARNMLPADPPLSIERIGCAICGSEDHFTILKANDYRFHVEGEFNVVQCPRCGLIYLNPRPVDIDKLYPQKYYIQNRFAGLASTLLAFVKVKRIMKLRRTGRILDVGCGDGGFLLYFKNRKWLVYGVDTSETACELARRRLEKIYECNLKGCHFPPRFFDIVTMNHVLELCGIRMRNFLRSIEF
ncbi:class I SAM-dependent methyltransferase, partial [Candidatus Bathyarchaeota archaeon]|nr:class I SAM-dependent methyltransferase [Candidatus Bathyarchaeota archaeon]